MVASVFTYQPTLRFLRVMLIASAILAIANLATPMLARAWHYEYTNCHEISCGNCWQYEQCDEYICPDGCTIGTCCFFSGNVRITKLYPVAHCCGIPAKVTP